MNPLIELGMSMALGRMQKPAGHALKRTGKLLKHVGQELEDIGDELIRSAPPVFTSAGTTSSRMSSSRPNYSNPPRHSTT